MFGISFIHWLVILSIFIGIGGAATYIYGTIVGKVKPNRVTWFMWALAPLVGGAAAISAHADFWATLRIFLAGFLPLIIFFASFVNPKSYWKVTPFDILCGACSLLALITWLGIDSPRLAILLAALGDGFAALPTMYKAWKYPETENGIIYIFSLIGVLLILPSIPEWNIQNSAFQVYLIIVNVLLIIAVYRKQGRFS